GGRARRGVDARTHRGQGGGRREEIPRLVVTDDAVADSGAAGDVYAAAGPAGAGAGLLEGGAFPDREAVEDGLCIARADDDVVDLDGAAKEAAQRCDVRGGI